jgi:hypothetical protein
MRPLARWLLPALLLAGCGSPAAPDERARLEQARAAWAAAGPDSYSFELTRSCECRPDGRLLVMVQNGVVTGAEYPEDSRPVEPTLLTYLPAIPDLFDLIEAALDRNAVSFTARYDPELGFPTFVAIDYSATIADDELTLSVSNLAATALEVRRP